MSKKCKRICKYLNYVEHVLILASSIAGCVSISFLASLVCVTVGIMSRNIKFCAIISGIQKYKPVVNKKKTHDKIVLLGKEKLNTIEVLISKALINSYISHDRFFQ